MARTFTLSELIEDVRARCDLQNDTGFVSDEELTRYLNQSLAEWYELVVQARGEEYFSKCADYDLNNCSTVTLPTDFYRLIGVDLLYGGRWKRLSPLQFSERIKYMNDTSCPHPLVYHVMNGTSLVLLPAPRSNLKLTIIYLPTAPTLDITKPDETINGFSGWEEYAVVDTSIKVLQKGDRDVSVLFAQKQMLEKRIENFAQDRHAEPSRIQEVQDVFDEIYPYGWRI